MWTFGSCRCKFGQCDSPGAVGEDPFARVCSQSSCYVLLGDAKLMRGEEGSFAVLDARSHRSSHVCRSTFAAELYSTEEAFDIGIYCHGAFAELQGKRQAHPGAVFADL